MTEENHPEKRLGPFAQDCSRTPPTKEQGEKDYRPEKNETGAAIRRKDDVGFPKNDESKMGLAIKRQRQTSTWASAGAGVNRSCRCEARHWAPSTSTELSASELRSAGLAIQRPSTGSVSATSAYG